jgi:hypothetical protein
MKILTQIMRNHVRNMIVKSSRVFSFNNFFTESELIPKENLKGLKLMSTQ